MSNAFSVYPFDPFGGQPPHTLTSQAISFARSVDFSYRNERSAQFRALSSALEAEFTLIYHLEVLWSAIRSLLRTYGRLGIGFAIDEDDLSYDDDVVWMAAKTEIGAAGEALRQYIGGATGLNAAGSAGSSSKSGTPSSGVGSPAATMSGVETADEILQRLRAGMASDNELRSRMRTLVMIYDALIRAKSNSSSWLTEKTVLRGSVYNLVLQGFYAYPQWHEDREFFDQLVVVVGRFVDYDR